MSRRNQPNPTKSGRPQGSKNAPVGQVVVVHQCPECKSTERERYRFASCVQHGGITAAGVEYSHVVRRRTKCRDCFKVRIDTFLENRMPDASPGDADEPQ